MTSKNSDVAAPTFADLGLSESTLKTLEKMGFTTPTPIQMLAIPEVAAGHDLLAQAQTGTGKTAAFTLPCLNKITSEKKIQVVILTPTRELAQQVADEFQRLGAGQKVEVATIIGGKSYANQMAQAARSQVLVATPGRLHDLCRTNKFSNLFPSIVILDEADRMLDMGFADDLNAIFSFLPKERQTLLFSATFTPNVQKLALKIQKADRKKVKAEATAETSLDIAQNFFVVRGSEKDAALCRWIDYEKPQKAIIFCEMKKDADRLGAALAKKDYPTYVLHGDTEQRRREEIMRNFKREENCYLVATDLAARGLDVSDVTHVVNFQIPWNQDSYVHRIGRTGRAGRKGIALSLVTPSEVRVLRRWEAATGSKMQEQQVPTLTQMRSKFIEALGVELSTGSTALEASLAVAELENTLPLAEIAGRLLQRLMKSQDLSGPEKIGGQAPRMSSSAPRGGGRNDRYGDRNDRGGDRGERSFSRGPRNFDRSNDRGSDRGSDGGRGFGGERSFSRGPRTGGEGFGERRERPSFSGGERSERPAFRPRSAEGTGGGGERRGGYGAGPRRPSSDRGGFSERTGGEKRGFGLNRSSDKEEGKKRSFSTRY
jgi:ATP-dependent RNA helicase DeaD